MSNDSLEIVYVLSNPAMPGIVKIGRTGGSDAQARISQLYSTGVPVPFQLEYACKVPNASEVELALHLAFGPTRVNPKREFFKIEPEQAIAVLQLLHTPDATEEINRQPQELDEQSLAAAEQLRRRRPNMNFTEMGIPTGASLQFLHGNTTATIVGPKKVVLNRTNSETESENEGGLDPTEMDVLDYSDAEEMSLTAATKELMQAEYSVWPAPHWSYNGKTIKEIYEETYDA
jgi:hypothetical protein